MSMAAATLCAGSYERFLFGFDFYTSGNDAAAPATSDGDSATLQRSFIQAAHQGVVKCLAAGGQWVASGGADDLVHLYDIKVRAKGCRGRFAGVGPGACRRCHCGRDCGPRPARPRRRPPLLHLSTAVRATRTWDS